MLWDLIARWIGYLGALIAAMGLQVVGIVLPAVTDNLAGVLASAVLYGSTFLGCVSLVLTMAGRLYPQSPARMMGRMTLAYGAAQIIAPALTGMLAESTGHLRHRPVSWPAASLPWGRCCWSGCAGWTRPPSVTGCRSQGGAHRLIPGKLAGPRRARPGAVTQAKIWRSTRRPRLRRGIPRASILLAHPASSSPCGPPRNRISHAVGRHLAGDLGQALAEGGAVRPGGYRHQLHAARASAWACGASTLAGELHAPGVLAVEESGRVPVPAGSGVLQPGRMDGRVPTPPGDPRLIGRPARAV